MSKLSQQDKFIDMSDYGRFAARYFVAKVARTSITPIQVTLLFGLAGLISIIAIILKAFLIAGIFLIIKSILDAADGELARVKKTPSYTGRYLDSIFDIVLNAGFLMAIQHIVGASFLLTFFAFISIQMQGTLYNYYYVILRNKKNGADGTSKIFEYKEPIALEGETQQAVHISYTLFNVLYSFFDKTIHLLDRNAYKAKALPGWFMTMVSFYGLGFQLLIIAVMLPLGLQQYIIPFFIWYNLLFVVLIGIRKFFLNDN
jgi:phosphatidylglycerophosphate synthase